MGGGIMHDVATNGSLAQPLQLINLSHLILFRKLFLIVSEITQRIVLLSLYRHRKVLW